MLAYVACSMLSQYALNEQLKDKYKVFAKLARAEKNILFFQITDLRFSRTKKFIPS